MLQALLRVLLPQPAAVSAAVPSSSKGATLLDALSGLLAPPDGTPDSRASDVLAVATAAVADGMHALLVQMEALRIVWMP
mgnify:CR=1 FL=1